MSTATDAPQPTKRISDRVADSVRYRPSCPAEVIDTLRREAGAVSTLYAANLYFGRLS